MHSKRKIQARAVDVYKRQVCASALLLMGTGLLFAKPLLILFGASKNALTFARPYMMLYLLGTLPSMIATGMNPFINAQGYSTTGMFSVAIGAIANILLDPLFIFTFHLGVNGAAAATVLSQILSAPVSYTHLDVYKRQAHLCACSFMIVQ